MKQDFEYIFWRSLQNAPPPEIFLKQCISFVLNQQHPNLPGEIDDQISLLIHAMRDHPCLLVLDNFESVMQPGRRAGHYREGYAAYGRLMQRVGEVQHQSCLLITSREKPKEVAQLEGTNSPIRSLQLSGLRLEAGQQMLQDKGLDGSDENLVALINLYSGNPLALNMASEYIKELFGGNIEGFLKKDENIYYVFQQLQHLGIDAPSPTPERATSYRKEQFITYGIQLAVSPDNVSIGGKLEVAIYLNSANLNIDNRYLFEVPKDEAARSELNLFVNAPGFQAEGDNTASLLLDLSVDGGTSSDSVMPQVARFPLIALRPGPATIAVELYRGSTFETTLKAEAQVTKIHAGEPPPPLLATRPRPVLLPDLLLQVSTDWNETTSACAFCYSFRSLRSSLLPAEGVNFRSEWLPAQWIGHTHTLLGNTLEECIGSLPENTYAHLVSFGQYLFHRLFPSELQREIRHLAIFRQLFTLLILADQDAWMPWELFHDGQTFLGERFLIGRWPREIGNTCPYEFPVGTIHMAYYANVPSSQVEMWATLFESPSIPPPAILPSGLFNTMASIEAMRGLYLMRLGQSSESDLRDTPALYSSIDDSDAVERELRPAKLSVRRNRPLVSMGYLSTGQPELTTVEQTWAPTFLRAGCSAFVGSLWAVQPAVEAAFVSGFYRRLWAGDSLGGAFNIGRKLAQIAVPESLDWLAYVLFGDPMARPYRPTKGQGYAVIEPIGREVDDPLPPSGTARFRVSLRRIPPVWHEERVIEVAEDLAFEKLEINIVAPSLQVTPPSPIEMTRTPTGDYLGWFTLVVPTVAASKSYAVQIYFMDGVQSIHRLRFQIKVGKQGGDQL